VPIPEVCVLLAKRTCDEGWFQCKYVFGCVPQSRFQDGTPDCYDKSDEDNQSMKLFSVKNCFTYRHQFKSFMQKTSEQKQNLSQFTACGNKWSICQPKWQGSLRCSFCWKNAGW